MKLTIIFALTAFAIARPFSLLAQPGPEPDQDIRINLKEDKSQYLKLTLLNQIWLRYTEANSGSSVYNNNVSEIYDIGLRRTRFQLYGPISPKVYVYFQFGQNNYSYLSKRFEGFFIHDATAEYRVNRALHIGAGLSGWSGMSRFASPSAGTILGLDVPLYQQATNSVSDQFLRKLGVYAKGKAGRIDYRLSLSTPSAIQNSNVPIATLNEFSEFNTRVPQVQKQAYISVQLADSESNDTPYTTGTYLGEKKVFNIGAGVIHQKDAQWHLNKTSDTVLTDMLLLGFDIYYDAPINPDKKNAISFYTALNYYDFGPKYSRNVGVMNPANGSKNPEVLSGYGNAFPMINSGITSYTQIGYLFGKSSKGTSRFGLYASSQLSDAEKFDALIYMIEGGLNWYIDGNHKSKLTFAYQNRGVYKQDINSVDFSTLESGRKGMAVVQFQVLR